MEVAVYRIKGGPLLDAVKETISSRLNTQSLMIDFCKQYGGQDYYLEGIDSPRIAGLRFVDSAPIPDGWQRLSPKSDIYTPWTNLTAKKQMDLIPNLPDEIDIITRLIDIPLFARLEKNGQTSSELFDGHVPFVGFLHAGIENDTFALWLPDVHANIMAWEADGYRVLDGVGSWEMSVTGLDKLSMSGWIELSNKHALID